MERLPRLDEPPGVGLWPLTLYVCGGKRELDLFGIACGGNDDCVLKLLDATLPKLSLRECPFALALERDGGGRLPPTPRCELFRLLETEGAGAASYESDVVGLR